MENLIGRQFGKLKVLRLSDNLTKNGRKMWLCQCECGNYREVIGAKLKSGSAKTCGCSRNKKIFAKEYIGKKINKWTILSVDHIENNKEFVLSKCECGNIEIVNFYNIYNNKSKDCGCGRKNKLSEISSIESMVGLKYGKLTVVEEVGKNKHNKTICKCKCECGSIINVLSNSLRTGHTLSCGCLTSKYNLKIKNIIDNLGYKCKTEKTIFLKDKEISWFRFDIYVEELNLAIEYDGEGHFKPIDFSGEGIECAIESLKKTQLRDKLKDEYCYNNNIYLLRIPFTQKYNIKKLIEEIINIITCND